MRFEIRRHWNKLLRISKLSDLELNTSYDTLLSKLIFRSEELIPKSIWLKAEKLVSDIDLDDTDFVALTSYLKGNLWTGDKPLYEGLKTKRFRTVCNTKDMITLRNRLSK